MGYIGPKNSDQFKSMSTQTITGNGSDTTFTLTTPVANSSEIRFVVNNVVQKPDVDYTASGTQLSTGSNVLASSDAAYVVNIGAAVGSQTPSDGSVDHTAISGSFNGMVMVSPELPISKDVPDCGSNLSTNKVPIILPLMSLLPLRY